MRAAVLEWARIFGNPLTWDDLGWLRSITDLPLVLKGICHPEDARRARDGGVDGIYCSNHGGRQANGGLPAVEALPGVVEAADGLPVLFDSGVRSGADVVKALALGPPPWVWAARTHTGWLSEARRASSTSCARCLPRPT